MQRKPLVSFYRRAFVEGFVFLNAITSVTELLHFSGMLLEIIRSRIARTLFETSRTSTL